MTMTMTDDRFELNFRQIHLDFHTSEHIPKVGAEFDPDTFADTLAKAHVNSVTCFARCHHGYIYYPSKVHPERAHPTLGGRNLLGEQIAACHKRGIRVPIYITVQWDQFTADRHRDWLHVDEEGREFSTRPLDAGFYRYLDVYHPGYRQFLFDHVRDVLDTFGKEVDGFFFDIVQPQPSLASHWKEGMAKAGVDPADVPARRDFARQVINAWKLEMTQFIRKHRSVRGRERDCTIFYNAGHIGPRHRDSREAYTHYELESLPSGGWGYMHFPLTQRYARGLSLRHDCMGMTGKFHTSWGDFQSYKNPAALEFECLQMIALGAKCSIGDQLPPSGRIDAATYELIGGVYAKVEAAEPWCRQAEPVSDIAVFTPEEFQGVRPGAALNEHERQPVEAIGALRMLTELHHQFDFVSSERPLSRYRMLILPDDIPVSAALARKLDAYVRSGGTLIASHKSGLDWQGGEFTMEAFGVNHEGEAPFSPDFIQPGRDLRRGLMDTAYVMYAQARRVRPRKDTTTLAAAIEPYFNRTWRHFCSHAHTPSSGKKAAYPAVTLASHGKGRCIYFAHPVFMMYHDRAPLWCKQLVANAIDLLMPRATLRTTGPSTMIASVSRQWRDRRQVVHLLHYLPERRGKQFDIIEDIIPIHDVTLQLACPKRVKSVTLAPSGEALEFMQTDGVVSCTVPTVHGHAIAVFSER